MTLDTKALEAAREAVNAEHFPERALMAEQAVRAYLSAASPPSILEEAARVVVENAWESSSMDGPLYCIDARLFDELAAAIRSLKEKSGE